MNKNLLQVIIIGLLCSFLLAACGIELDDQTNVPVENHSQEIVDDSEVMGDSPVREITDTPGDSLDELKVHYIDAGQADATLFQLTVDEEPFTILYDAGDWNKNDVVDYLTTQKITAIDLVIISHPHADHTGQLADIMNTFAVGEVWLSGNTSTSQTFQQGLEAVLASGADYDEPRAGDEFAMGPLKIDVLHPGDISGKLNEESISLLFTYGDVKFIFTGDAGKNEELEMMERGFVIKADFLSLGHHGSKTSTDPAFIKAVNPEVAIYSAGEGNSYGHPHPEVVSRIEDAGITLFGTDIHGTILVTTDGQTYGIATEREGTVTAGGSEKEKPAQPKQESPASDSCIDINQASIEDVQKIIHIGTERARELIGHRPFDSVDDLDIIKGIGPARLDDIKDEGIACVQ